MVVEKTALKVAIMDLHATTTGGISIPDVSHARRCGTADLVDRLSLVAVQ